MSDETEQTTEVELDCKHIGERENCGTCCGNPNGSHPRQFCRVECDLDEWSIARGGVA